MIFSAPAVLVVAGLISKCLSAPNYTGPRDRGTWKYIGCFSPDDGADNFMRILTPFNTTDEPNTIEICISACEGFGSPYAGLVGADSQDKSCKCVQDFAISLGSKPADDCSVPCPDGSEGCGGARSFGIWEDSSHFDVEIVKKAPPLLKSTTGQQKLLADDLRQIQDNYNMYGYNSFCTTPHTPKNREILRHPGIEYPLGGINLPMISCVKEKERWDHGRRIQLEITPWWAKVQNFTKSPNVEAKTRIYYDLTEHEIRVACYNSCLDQYKNCLEKYATVETCGHPTTDAWLDQDVHYVYNLVGPVCWNKQQLRKQCERQLNHCHDVNLKSCHQNRIHQRLVKTICPEFGKQYARPRTQPQQLIRFLEMQKAEKKKIEKSKEEAPVFL